MKISNIDLDTQTVASILSDNTLFEIPRYQRVYQWRRHDWERLYNDLTENESGYFLGSLLFVRGKDKGIQFPVYEVIDGQQRLTTISILLIAWYSVYKENLEHPSQDKTQYESKQYRKLLNKLDDVEDYLIVQQHNKNRDKESVPMSRLSPQPQGMNYDDYLALLSDRSVELLPASKKPPYMGSRRISDCYLYFRGALEEDIKKTENSIEKLQEILLKITSAILVSIVVPSQADAFTLFSALNDTGVPLSSIDLIKNHLIAKIDKTGISTNSAYDEWRKVMENLKDNQNIAERFFRQTYNAFRKKFNIPYRKDSVLEYPLGSIAIRSTMLQIYKKIIDKDPNDFIERMKELSGIYSQLIDPSQSEYSDRLVKGLADLIHIEATPSYVLLIHLLSERKALQLDDELLAEIVEILVCFFVRRNLTDVPPTRDLVRIFMEVIDTIETDTLKSFAIRNIVLNKVINTSVSDDLFEQKLRGSIYSMNYGVTRFILCSLAEKQMNKEFHPDLWERNKKDNKYIWTVEHIFPEGENIPGDWVKMIANGDSTLAKVLQKEYVHTIGNLTLTGFNSNLSNKPFIYKRDYQKDGVYSGYKNRLSINKGLDNKKEWTIDDIKIRTDTMVKDTLKIFSLNKS